MLGIYYKLLVFSCQINLETLRFNSTYVAEGVPSNGRNKSGMRTIRTLSKTNRSSNFEQIQVRWFEGFLLFITNVVHKSKSHSIIRTASCSPRCYPKLAETGAEVQQTLQHASHLEPDARFPLPNTSKLRAGLGTLGSRSETQKPFKP